MRKLLSIALISVGLGTFANADTFNLHQGWNLVGSSNSVDLSKDFNKSNISVVWRYENGQWQYYTSSDAVKSQIGNKHILFTKTSPNEGFWVYAIGNVNINTGDKKANIQGYQNSDNNSTSTKKPFITVWEINSNKKNITIPINPKYAGNYNYTVNWGDGSISKNVDKSITHTYAKDGNYTVKINGVFPAIYLDNGGHDLNIPNYIGNPDKLIEIKQWGDIKWKSFRLAFAGAHDLKITATDTPNLKNVKDMSGAFADDDTNTFNNINNWNVSNVTDMGWMFYGATSFNQPLNNWNVSNVTSMRSMFYGATSFNQPLNNWNVSNVTSMKGMFYGATAFNQPLNNWDVTNVTDMSWMFHGATAFNQPLNNWNVSNVTNMDGMFQSATAFNQPLNNWDVTNVTNMKGMFYKATAFNQPLNNWNVSNVTDMSWMFAGATSFNQNISNWDVSNVTAHTGFADNGCPISDTNKMPKFK